jgi:dolichol kinase
VLLFKKGKLSKYFVRKFVHTAAGLTILTIPFLSTPIISLIISGFATIFLRVINNKSRIQLIRDVYNTLAEEEELELGYLQGPFGYSLAITVMTFIYVLFPAHVGIIVTSIFIMIFADTMAGIIGRKYGKHKIVLFNKIQKRSIEGSFIMFLFSFLISISIFLLMNSYKEIFLIAIVTSIVATAIEMLSPSKWDDLAIPIGTSLIMIIFLQGLV